MAHPAPKMLHDGNSAASSRDRSFHRLAVGDDPVDETELLRLFGGHEMIAVERLLDRFVILARMLDVHLVEAALQLDDVLRVAFDVRGLAGEAAGWLVNHDARIRRGEAHVLVTRAQKQRTHRSRLAD